MQAMAADPTVHQVQQDPAIHQFYKKKNKNKITIVESCNISINLYKNQSYQLI